MMIEFMYK